MQAYKFETTVGENGTIQVPELKKFKDKKVELFVVLRPEEETDTKDRLSIEAFLNKWSGFFEPVETDDMRYNYLMEKYKWELFY